MISLLPVGVNLLGKSVYLYIDLGDQDLIFGASIGVSHNAIADSYDPDAAILGIVEAYEGYSGASYEFGPVEVIVEQGQGFEPFRLDIFADHDYWGVEFPWLLIPGFLFGLAFWRFYWVLRRK